MMLRLLVVFAVVGAMARAQQPIGTVGVQDATVAGALVVTNGRAVLVGNTTVTAKDHTAEVALSRGGSVRVCSTSGLHMTAGKSAGEAAPLPLMLALDRGAVEVQMAATTSDVVMTPDLRFTLGSDGPLDMRLRVTSNGDTCVENRGASAPMLRVVDPFGGAMYELRAGQHVLFEHGSLKEVVDNESSPCGCPPMPVVSVADAGVSSPTGAGAAVGSAVAAKSVEEQHPFPAAVSAGLAPVATAPQAPPGVVHTQVATSLHYDAGTAAGTAGSTEDTEATGNAKGTSPSTTPVTKTAGTAATVPVAATAEAPPPPGARPAKGLAHSIGRFFKRLFGRH